MKVYEKVKIKGGSLGNCDGTVGGFLMKSKTYIVLGVLRNCRIVGILKDLFRKRFVKLGN